MSAESEKSLTLATRAVHVPSTGEVRGRPVSVPIYQTSVFAHDDPDELTATLNDPRGGFGYSRNGNSTVRALEQAVAGLEGAVGAVATSSGMGAIAVALGAQLRSGSRIVVQEAIYGGTTQGCCEIWCPAGGSRSSTLPVTIRRHWRRCSSRAPIWCTWKQSRNPMTAVADTAGMSAVARSAGVITVVDNTFASPILCRPIGGEAHPLPGRFLAPHVQ